MTSIKPHEYDPDAWDDEDEGQSFERLRKQTSKPATVKADRRQQEKEWGRAINKFHKERSRQNGGKP
ncbi:MAG: hypothetical protein RLZZ387_2945 [Chloroflexota bacterium]